MVLMVMLVLLLMLVLMLLFLIPLLLMLLMLLMVLRAVHAGGPVRCGLAVVVGPRCARGGRRGLRRGGMVVPGGLRLARRCRLGLRRFPGIGLPATGLVDTLIGCAPGTDFRFTLGAIAGQR